MKAAQPDDTTPEAQRAERIAPRIAARTDDYREKLQAGLRFQDFVTRHLYGIGIVLVQFVAVANNLDCENMAGFEIKRDGRFRQTGNLYFETDEKTDPANPVFVPSGIRRRDSSWIWIIGDELTLWFFTKKQLLVIDKSPERWKAKRVETATSKGFVLPLDQADRYCARKLEIESNGVILEQDPDGWRPV
jgi:hypothetical protein